MKKTIPLFSVIVLSLLAGFFAGCSWHPAAVKAAPVIGQIISPHLICGGSHDCSQYIVEIATQRGFGRFSVYQVGQQADVVNTSVCCALVAGGDVVIMQATEATPRETQTFTMTLNEP